MPFPSEEAMKRAISAIEQGVGADEWCTGLVFADGKMCALGLAARGEGATAKDLVSLSTELAASRWLGLRWREAKEIAHENDENGPEAAIEAIRKIGFESGDQLV